MFVLLENNQIVSGPNHWNKRKLQSILLDDYEIEYELPLANDANQFFEINSELRILPVIGETVPAFNPKIEQLAGPFVEVSENSVTLSYQKSDKDITSVKNELKNIIADNRWKLEVNGIAVNVQGQDIKLSTARGERDIFLQALQLGHTDQQWKFGDIWLTLSLSDLQTIVTTIVSHVQMAFNWESEKIAEIDSATTLPVLDSIVLKHQILIDQENLLQRPLFM